ncbi:hypothetical protein ONE63_003602 [Megalurothrips usitatus]|uniref:Uncharacterized protein n=1 Tax=Megalurothrips usitatus TaxID=439358 RepID=A0AAV7XA14_9NEOP|nr:hypothetical protein ONE63_003602 [Megalurothrips usitatus]
MGDRLREVCIRFTRSTADLLQEALRVPALRYLEVHCPFDAPLECPRLPGRSPSLRWLRAGVYPLLTALALIRQCAATLEELELVAASTDPYGCPDLGEALRGCELRGLRKLTLLRATVDDTPCRHDELTCREQRLRLLFALKGVSACEVRCNECGTRTFDELLRNVFSAAAREGNRAS